MLRGFAFLLLQTHTLKSQPSIVLFSHDRSTSLDLPVLFTFHVFHLPFHTVRNHCSLTLARGPWCPDLAANPSHQKLSFSIPSHSEATSVATFDLPPRDDVPGVVEDGFFGFVGVPPPPEDGPAV